MLEAFVNLPSSLPLDVSIVRESTGSSATNVLATKVDIVRFHWPELRVNTYVATQGGGDFALLHVEITYRAYNEADARAKASGYSRTESLKQRLLIFGEEHPEYRKRFTKNDRDDLRYLAKIEFDKFDLKQLSPPRQL